MNDQEKIMSALAQGYQVLSKAMKQKPSKEGFQQILQMLGDDGIQACVQVVDQGPEAIAQTMAKVIQQKQTQKAEKGAKLNRLMALNNSCPEGYLKKGGKCKKCEKEEKLNPHKALFTPAAYFKNGGINKMFLGSVINIAKNVGNIAKTVKGAIGSNNTQQQTTQQSAANDWNAQQQQAQANNTTAITNATANGQQQAQLQNTTMNALAQNATAAATNGLGGMNNPNNFQANLMQSQNNMGQRYNPRKQKVSGQILIGITPTWMT